MKIIAPFPRSGVSRYLKQNISTQIGYNATRCGVQATGKKAKQQKVENYGMGRYSTNLCVKKARRDTIIGAFYRVY